MAVPRLLAWASLFFSMMPVASLKHGIVIPKDTLIIVRTHQPSEHMTKRMLDIVRDVATNLPTAHVLISVDDSNLAVDERLQMPSLRPCYLHRYTWDGVVSANKRVAWSKIDPPADGRFFHMEPIIMAMEHAQAHTAMAKDFKVWAMEDDVLVCGNFTDIVQRYHNDTSDLLTGRDIPENPWPNENWTSPEFAKRYPLPKRQKSFEFVERFSKRLLVRARQLTRHQGVTSLSEMLAPTICHEEGFKHGRFEAENMGVWDWWKHISPGQADLVCSQEQPTMNHAAKFLVPSKNGIFAKIG